MPKDVDYKANEGIFSVLHLLLSLDSHNASKELLSIRTLALVYHDLYLEIKDVG